MKHLLRKYEAATSLLRSTRYARMKRRSPYFSVRQSHASWPKAASFFMHRRCASLKTQCIPRTRYSAMRGPLQFHTAIKGTHRTIFTPSGRFRVSCLAYAVRLVEQNGSYQWVRCTKKELLFLGVLRPNAYRVCGIRRLRGNTFPTN